MARERVDRFSTESGSGYEEAFIRLGIDSIGGYFGGYVLNEFATSLGAFSFQLADTARGHIAGFEADDASVADFDLRPKPVGTEHASGGVERHGGGDGAFELRSCARKDTLAHFLRPCHPAHERIIQTAALEGHSVRELAQLQELKED